MITSYHDRYEKKSRVKIKVQLEALKFGTYGKSVRFRCTLPAASIKEECKSKAPVTVSTSTEKREKWQPSGRLSHISNTTSTRKAVVLRGKNPFSHSASSSENVSGCSTFLTFGFCWQESSSEGSIDEQTRLIPREMAIGKGLICLIKIDTEQLLIKLNFENLQIFKLASLYIVKLSKCLYTSLISYCFVLFIQLHHLYFHKFLADKKKSPNTWSFYRLVNRE